MKALYRRRRQQYLFASLLGFIGVINLLFFLILYQPERSRYYRLQDSIEKLRASVQTQGQSVERLDKLSAQLETSAQDRLRLYTMHFIPRNAGWSELLPQLEAMTQRAAVKNTRKGYAIDETPQYGLYSVKIGIPVTGGYSSLVSLIKELEKSDTFFIINSIDMRGGATPGVPEVAMGLNIETFFYQ